MSRMHTDWAWSQVVPEISTTELLVLLVIARKFDSAEHGTDTIQISTEDIARETAISVRSVSSAIRVLVTAGKLLRYKRWVSDSGARDHNAYALRTDTNMAVRADAV